MSNKRLVLTFLTLAVLLICGYFIFIIISRHGKTKVTISTSPSTAEIMVNEEKSKKTLYLADGSYTISVGHDGFAPQSQTIDINNTNGGKLIFILEAINETGEDYLNSDTDEQQEREKLGGEQFSIGSQQIAEKYPYLGKLPIEGRAFSVSYGDTQNTKLSDNEKAVALYVIATDASQRKNALNNISKELGIQYYDIEIIFKDYRNPFLGVAHAE